MIEQAEIEKDIDLILWSAQLKEVYRYQKQKFWEKETAQHEQAMLAYPQKIEDNKFAKSESVAEHSWHMADIVMIIGPRFPQLDLLRCLKLTNVHDKLEIITDDADPLGKDGKGTDTHAYNLDRKAEKEKQERLALASYLQKCSQTIREEQEDLFLDAIELRTINSKFAKAIDRIQPLTYIFDRKNGVMEDDHILFTINYTGMCKDYFPEIKPYHDALAGRLLDCIAAQRQMTSTELKQHLRL